MDYLSGENPRDLMRDVFLANIERFYNIYVQHCIDHNVVAISKKEALEGKEMQEILERWNDVYSYTEYDPDIELK